MRDETERVSTIYRATEYGVLVMSTSIRISDETKQKLEAIKRDDESFDDLLDRLARTEKDVEAIAGFGPEGIDRSMRDARESARDEYAERTGE